MKIILQVRDLADGAPSQQPFDDEAAAIAWLRDRPHMREVIGVADTGVPHDVDGRLRAAMRPLDDAERAAEERLGVARDAEHRARAEAMMKRALEDAERQRADAADVDPDSIMQLHWSFAAGLRVADPHDGRGVSKEAEQAVNEWIAERNTWVEGRGQVVGDARLRVYPGALPAGVDARVEWGTFIPVTAPKKD